MDPNLEGIDTQSVAALTLGYLDDETLYQACVVNKKFAHRVCNNVMWVNKIMQRTGMSRQEMDLYRGNNNYWAFYNIQTS